MLLIIMLSCHIKLFIAAKRNEAAFLILSPGLRDLLVAFDQNKICRSVVLSFCRSSYFQIYDVVMTSQKSKFQNIIHHE